MHGTIKRQYVSVLSEGHGTWQQNSYLTSPSTRHDPVGSNDM